LVFYLRDYLYPTQLKIVDKNASPWDKYDQFTEINEQIQDNLRKLTKEQLDNLTNRKYCF
jgi:hypothetical protein